MSHRAILAGLAAGLALGLLAAATGSELLATLAEGVRPLGELFLHAVRMVVIPLVVATVFAGVCALGEPGRLGRLGGATLAFFWGTTLVGIALGMGLMRLGTRFAAGVQPEAEASGVSEEIPGVFELPLRLVPPNPIAAAAEGELLPLLVFTVLFAAAAGTLEEERRTRLEELAMAVRDALVRLVRWILWTAPLGIFGLVAPATAS